MKNNDNQIKAYFLSFLIHGLLAVFFIVSASQILDPQGTVQYTEFELSDSEPPKGNQTKDITQNIDAYQEKKKAPKPKRQSQPLPEQTIDEILAQEESDVAVAKKLPQKKKRENLAAKPNLKAIEEAEKSFDDILGEEEESIPSDIDDNPFAANEEDPNEITDQAPAAPVTAKSTRYGIPQGAMDAESLSPAPGNVPPEYPQKSCTAVVGDFFKNKRG